MNVKQKHSLQFRLSILLRRESRVCLQMNSQERPRYGFILNCKSESVLFKECVGRPESIPLDDIKFCRAVGFED